jgi:hypothetical protein
LASHVNNRVLRGRLILVTGLFMGGFSGAALGAWTANLIQASRYNDPDWEWLDAALVALFSALLGLAGVDCSRCIIAVPPVAQRPPSGRCWAIARTLTRIAIGAVGLRLGAEAGFLLSILWDTFGSAATNAAEAYREFVNVWIALGCLIGGSLAVLGYRVGTRAPAAAAFIGSYAALWAVPHVAPAVADLYWGPYPSSDFHALVTFMAALLTTCLLVLVFALVGYWLARWAWPTR